MMKTKYLAAVSALLLAGCVYSETPYGRYAAIDLHGSRTTVNKTVTINAPPGTTVVYGRRPPRLPPIRAVTTVLTTGQPPPLLSAPQSAAEDRCTAWKAKAAA